MFQSSADGDKTTFKVTLKYRMFELKPDEAVLTAASPDRGESREQVPITYNGPTITLALAGNQLLEFLRQAVNRDPGTWAHGHQFDNIPADARR